MLRLRKKQATDHVAIGDSAGKTAFRKVTSLVLVCATFAAMSYLASESPASGEKGLGSMTVSAGVPLRAKRSKPEEEEISYLTTIVNETNTLPEEYTPEDLVLVSYTDVRLVEEAAKQMEALMAELEQQGMSIQLVTGYVSYGRQATFFDRQVTALLREQGELTFDEALQEAAKLVELPGASEHQTGYAIDIAVDDLVGTSIEETAEGLWLLENAHRFGFIQRYPQEKSELTGVADEPWHFRYVGKDLAQQLYAAGLCLEEQDALVELYGPEVRPQADPENPTDIEPDVEHA